MSAAIYIAGYLMTVVAMVVVITKKEDDDISAVLLTVLGLFLCIFWPLLWLAGGLVVITRWHNRAMAKYGKRP